MTSWKFINSMAELLKVLLKMLQALENGRKVNRIFLRYHVSSIEITYIVYYISNNCS